MHGVALNALQAEEIGERARGQHQIVVTNITHAGNERVGRRVDALHVGHAVEEVFLPRENLSNRIRDAVSFECPGGYLVQQRLEIVVIIAVDDHDLHGGFVQCLS